MSLSTKPSSRLAFNSPMAAKLQKGKVRKTLVFLTVLLGILLGLLPAYFGWVLITSATAGIGFILISGVAAISAFLLERILYMSIQTALPIEGQPYDERQQQLFTSAQISARKIMNIALFALAFWGLFTTYWSSTSGALAEIIPLHIWISSSLLFIAYEAPYLILAWRMPDEGDIENG